ncbi:hypothetical protein Moror_10976 [Moniliophthora roreri MCA 2997]|uniref:Uncharacterized protein n=1 Tax=Moniliophthora roreri (strain MCA 2997) TaxID=1381753 RepID=V2WXB2_MONRO|nr:hypothetical protein Moror_10976 [Moniliophthora roreri MCA 2997]KAI3609558.1 hypothetical protein WG66_001306 [Moniliophthora roreri]
MSTKSQKTRRKLSQSATPTLQEQYRPAFEAARAKAAGNLFTFDSDGSGKSTVVPYPIHPDGHLYSATEVQNATQRGWMPKFVCADGKAAKLWKIKDDARSDFAGKHLIACVRGSSGGCGYFFVIEEVRERGARELIVQDYESAFERAQDELSKPRGPLPSPPRSPVEVDMKAPNPFDTDISDRAQTLYGRSDTRISPDHSMIMYDPSGQFEGLYDDGTFAFKHDTPTKPARQHTKPTRKRPLDSDEDEVTVVRESFKTSSSRPVKRTKFVNTSGSMPQFVEGSSKIPVIDLTKD